MWSFLAFALDAPLYRQPFFGTLAAGVAAVALGIARNALDSLLELAPRRRRGTATARRSARTAAT